MLLPALKGPALGRAVANDGELLVDVGAHSLSVRALSAEFLQRSAVSGAPRQAAVYIQKFTCACGPGL